MQRWVRAVRPAALGLLFACGCVDPTSVVSSRLAKPPAAQAGPGEIAFWESAKNTAAIKAMASDGRLVGTIISGIAGPAEISWAPDGSALAYNDPFAGEIHRVAASGGNEVFLLNAAQCGGFCAAPAWSPVGNEIAVIGRRADAGDLLLVVPASGGTPTELYVGDSDDRFFLDVAWSADGSQLALSFRSLAGTGDDGVLVVERSSGASTRILTVVGVNSLDWARGGSPTLAITIGYGAEASIHLFDTSVSQTIDFAVAGRHPSFSPDNQFIVYEEVTSSNCCKVELATGTTTRLRRQARRPDWCRTCNSND